MFKSNLNKPRPQATDYIQLGSWVKRKSEEEKAFRGNIQIEDGPPSFYDGAPLEEPAGRDGSSAASGAGDQAAMERAAQRARPVGLRVLPGGHPAAGR